MIIACKLDDSKFTSEDVAEFIDLCRKCGIECNIPAQVPTVSVPAPTLPMPKAKVKPKATLKPMDPPTDILFPYSVNEYGIILGNGKGKTGTKEMLKHYGFTYDYKCWAWVGGDYNLLPRTATHLKVSAKWVQVGRDVAKARQEAKG